MVDWPQHGVVSAPTVDEFLSLLARGRLDRYPLMTWRGAASIDWPLDSALARRVIHTVCRGDRNALTEQKLAQAEAMLVSDARWLQLDHGLNGRMTDLELLAVLQHQGAATRLVDVSSNALVAAWFAVENNAHDNDDGVVFGIDMTERVLSDEQSTKLISEVLQDGLIWLWNPPLVDQRIRAQQGAFLLSVIPDETVRADRSLTSLALEVTEFEASRLFSANPGQGRFPKSPVVIIRIPKGVKKSLRQFLRGRLGYTTEVMYPDLAGFARARKA